MCNCFDCGKCTNIDASGERSCTIDNNYINMLRFYYHLMFGCKYFEVKPTPVSSDDDLYTLNDVMRKLNDLEDRLIRLEKTK
jgi:hypothetical protein